LNHALSKDGPKETGKKHPAFHGNKCFSTLAMEEALHCAVDKKEKGVNHVSK